MRPRVALPVVGDHGFMRRDDAIAECRRQAMATGHLHAVVPVGAVFVIVRAEHAVGPQPLDPALAAAVMQAIEHGVDGSEIAKFAALVAGGVDPEQVKRMFAARREGTPS